jgi:hypothetical protein
MNDDPVVIKPAVLAWALGFGVFLSFVGASAIGPPDPLTQLFVAGPLLLVVVPVIYLVLDADDVARHDEKSRVPLPYLIVVTLTSVLASVLVPLPETGLSAIVGRGAAFLLTFGAVSWLAIQYSLDTDETALSTK